MQLAPNIKARKGNGCYKRMMLYRMYWLIVLYFIRIAMQVEQDRNSFDISYAHKPIEEPQPEKDINALSTCFNDADKIDVAEVRLSAGKQKMLESFKSTIREEANGFHEQLKQSVIDIY